MSQALACFPTTPKSAGVDGLFAAGRVCLLACLLALLGWAGALSGAAAAERRVALVVGNSSYKEAPELANPRNDAHDLAATLKEVGFEVIEASDVDKRGMDMALANFNRSAKGATVALFYFAGHGLQYNGANYILPIDAKLEDDVGLRYEAISLDQVRAAVEEASGVKIMILDACRNNPLAGRLSRSVLAGGARSAPLTRGLARVEQTTGTVVAYATQANQVAEDGGGRNSPFTLALIENLREPGIEIGSLFRRVASSVYERTNGRQTPELSISLLTDFYLNQRETDMQAWGRVRNSTDLVGLRDFIQKYPSSLLADAARAKLETAERGERDALERNLRLEQERVAREARDQRIRDQIATLQRELAPAQPLPEALKTPALRGDGDVKTAVAPMASPRLADAKQAEPPKPTSKEPVREEVSSAPTLATPPPSVAPASVAPVAAAATVSAAKTTSVLAALPTPAEVAARVSPASDAVLRLRFQAEMRRLGCYSAARDKDWQSKATKQALALAAKPLHLAVAPARLESDQLDTLDAYKGRLCPSLCNSRQVETGSGRCVAKTCGPGERLDGDGDCVARAPRSARSFNKPEPDKSAARRARAAERVAARPEPKKKARRRLRENDGDEQVITERRPRRVIEEPAIEARRPCSGASIGIGIGPIRLATPFGGRC